MTTSTELLRYAVESFRLKVSCGEDPSFAHCLQEALHIHEPERFERPRISMSKTKVTDHGVLHGCPFCFCESPPILYCHEADGIPELEPIYVVECSCCGATGTRRDTPRRAVEWWNGDHKLDGASRQKKRERLVAGIKALVDDLAELTVQLKTGVEPSEMADAW